ncbi:hypothetical protein KDE12_01215 [Campylobacter sp. faydin G-105]|nr:hypothetical protein [Campylobacter anatolicus]
MMQKIKTTTNKLQTQTFTYADKELELTLKFNSVGVTWQYDLTNANTGEIYAKNKGLAVNAPSLINKNLGFILILIDESKEGVNAVDISEMSKRLNLYIADISEFKETMRAINATI